MHVMHVMHVFFRVRYRLADKLSAWQCSEYQGSLHFTGSDEEIPGRIVSFTCYPRPVLTQEENPSTVLAQEIEGVGPNICY